MHTILLYCVIMWEVQQPRTGYEYLAMNRRGVVRVAGDVEFVVDQNSTGLY